MFGQVCIPKLVSRPGPSSSSSALPPNEILSRSLSAWPDGSSLLTKFSFLPSSALSHPLSGRTASFPSHLFGPRGCALQHRPPQCSLRQVVWSPHAQLPSAHTRTRACPWAHRAPTATSGAQPGKADLSGQGGQVWSPATSAGWPTAPGQQSLPDFRQATDWREAHGQEGVS